MSPDIFAIVRIGEYKLLVGEAHRLREVWPPLLDRLNRGEFPHRELQQAWNQTGNQRRFSFHTGREIAADRSIIRWKRSKNGRE
ncbi:MAG: hypothetical protein J7641_18200 [Cyanobacteria bacterium SID2]|nr:hypothetical protein [Cyanobacteria bacterium SID2]MBP0006297.1 hypothetical protein [Cyanobacteria bacterium SBC]